MDTVNLYYRIKEGDKIVLFGFSNSFTCQMGNIFDSLFLDVTRYIKETNTTSRRFDSNDCVDIAFPPVVIGTGTTAVDYCDYKLESKLTTGITKLSESGYTEDIKEGSIKVGELIVLNTVYQNNSGSDIQVKEIGFEFHAISSSYTFLGARDNIDYTFRDSSIVAFEYIMEVRL